jgi:hypothetical protein
MTWTQFWLMTVHGQCGLFALLRGDYLLQNNKRTDSTIDHYGLVMQLLTDTTDTVIIKSGIALVPCVISTL